MKRLFHHPIFIFIVWGLSPLTLQAQVTWTGGDWEQSSSWSSGFVPSGLVTGIEVISSDSSDTQLYYRPISTANHWYVHVINVIIDGRNTGNVTLLQEEHPLGFDATVDPFNLGPSEFSATNLSIGHTGWGTYDLAGGILRIGNTLTIGSEQIPQTGDPTAFGLLKIRGNAELIAEPTGSGKVWRVGDGHNGKIEQSGGHVKALYGFNSDQDTQFVGQSPYILAIGQTGNPQTTTVKGTYELTGGILDINEIRLGWVGHGEFEQTGGTVNVGKLFVGHSVIGSTGQYLLNGGTLNSTFHAQGVVVGRENSTGVFTHQAGTHTSSGVVVADGGQYLLSGGSLNSFLGVGLGGIYNQQGGTQTGSKNITGQFLLSGGTSSGYFQLNEGGLVTHTGGTNNTSAFNSPSLNIQGGNYLLQGTGIFTSANEALIGSTGTGTFTQSGGQSTFSDNVIIGEQAGSNGTFNFTGGTASLGNITVGKEGTGAFSQSQTTLTGVGSILLGTESTGDGSWFSTFNAQLSASSTDIGLDGTGFMHLIDGDTIFGGKAALGTNSSGSGTLEIDSGSTFTSNALAVGEYGTGRVDLDGGTLDVNTSATVADQNGSSGQIVQDGGSLTSVSTVVGVQGMGSYDHNAGSHQTGSLALGFGGTGHGTYRYVDGSLDITNSLLVGAFGTGWFYQGTFGAQTGPSLSLTQDLILGQQTGSFGYFIMDSGSLNVPDLIVGQSGTGEFTQTGGQVTLTGGLDIEEQSGSSGTVTLNGGTFGTSSVDVGGLLHINGGALTSSGLVSVPNQAGAQLRIQSGSLTTDSLNIGNATAGLSLLGGSLTVNSDTDFGLFSGEIIGPVQLSAPATLQINGTSEILNFGSVSLSHAGAQLGATQLNVKDGGSLSMSAGTLSLGGLTLEEDVTFTGGTATVSGDIDLNRSSVDLRLENSAQVNVGTDFHVGEGFSANINDVRLSDSSSLDVDGTFLIGSGSNADSFVSISDSASLVANDMLIGNFGSGWLRINSGTFTVEDTLESAFFNGGSGRIDFRGGTSTIENAILGDEGRTTVNHSDGAVSITSLLLGQFATARGTYHLSGGTLNTGDTIIGDFATGSFEHTGGTHTSSGTVTIEKNPSATGSYTLNGSTSEAVWDAATVENNGTFTISGLSRFTAKTFHNHGTFEYHSANLDTNPGFNPSGAFVSPINNTGNMTLQGGYQIVVSGAVTNSGTALVTNLDSAQFAQFTNTGQLTILNSNASFGDFISSGAVIVDPSVVNFTDVTFQSTGYLTATADDEFRISGDFTNLSTENALWDTDEAHLVFTGTTGTRTWRVAGTDLGADEVGFDQNFAWGVLELESGVSLSIENGSGSALYVRELRLADGLAQLGLLQGTGTLYYDASLPENAYLSGGSHSLTGGGLLTPAVIPELSTLSLSMISILLSFGWMCWRRRA